jgi:hypothetical protein
LQTSPPDTSLLRLPLAPPLPSSCSALPPPLTAGTKPRAPPPAAAHVHSSSPLDPDLISLPWWPRARAPRRPEPSPAATSSSPWIAPCRALTSSLSRAAAPLQHLRAVLLLPATNFEHPSHIFPAAVLLRFGRARHSRGQPSPAHPRPNQHLHKLPCYLPVLDDQLFSSNFHWNFVSDEAPPPPPSASPWAARSEPLHATTIP